MAQSGKVKIITAWVLQILLAAVFLTAGILKLTNVEAMVVAFDKIGWGHWFLYLTGVLEVAGAIGLLVPRLAFSAAVCLALVMAVAVVFCIAVLHQNPVPPALFALLSGAVAYLRRP